LFEEHGLTRVISGPATTLEVELTAFEELVGPPNRVRASVVVIVHDQRAVLLERTMTVEKAVTVAAAGGDGVVIALSDALAAIVGDVTEAVVAELGGGGGEAADNPVAGRDTTKSSSASAGR
jgi:hypothetical protein